MSFIIARYFLLIRVLQIDNIVIHQDGKIKLIFILLPLK